MDIRDRVRAEAAAGAAFLEAFDRARATTRRMAWDATSLTTWPPRRRPTPVPLRIYFVRPDRRQTGSGPDRGES